MENEMNYFNKYKFLDNVRAVDFILIYNPNSKEEVKELRNIFLNNIIIQGLQYEEESRFSYYKIHAPSQVLFNYCDAFFIKMPIKNNIVKMTQEERKLTTYSCLNWFILPTTVYKPSSALLRGRLDLFDYTENFFPSSIRSMVVHSILNTVSFSDDSENVGLLRLLKEHIFDAAFPLHDGLKSDTRMTCQRHNLYKIWGSFKNIYHPQPINLIREYFGLRVTYYFLWIGFYTFMLIPPSIAGILCLIYGLLTKDHDELSKDICNPHINYTMCPKCDGCDYWSLIEACKYSKISYAIDNHTTVVFAMFVSIWSVVFMQLWKRFTCEVSYAWGISVCDLEDEIPLPSYVSALKRMSQILYWKNKFPRRALGNSISFILATVVIITMFSIVLYKTAASASITMFSDKSQYQNLVIPISAGIINLIAIYILNYFYTIVAYHLTKIEYRRTQTEFDDSLSLKIYIFQFINYYSSLFYIAFFKGNFAGYPKKYHRIFGYRQEECGPGGCLVELFIQLAVIFTGKEVLKVFKNFTLAYLKPKFRKSRCCGRKRYEEEGNTIDKQVKEDVVLSRMDSMVLILEHVEVAIQYGFVTLFAVAFPLAPLLALLKNLFEIRATAVELLYFTRRPVDVRINDIGIWHSIMQLVTLLGVLTNAIIIACTSHAVPKILHRLTVEDYNQKYLDFQLSIFNVTELETQPVSKYSDVKICRYLGHRKQPQGSDKYQNTAMHWYLFGIKFIFVLVYQNIVFFIMAFIQWFIPIEPMKVKTWRRQEAKYIKSYMFAMKSNMRFDV